MKFILTLALALVLMLAVRSYAFTIYKVPNSSLEPVLKKNDRVVVNRLSRGRFLRGDIVVFTADSSYIGVIGNIPGDTVALGGRQYVLPERCGCQRCGCSERAVFLVRQGGRQALIHRDDIIGKAYRLSFAQR
ncbi:MAG: signal peptidase I [Prevotellaceae bacterium]|nr:signal peptidase I [Prevotellaceae bacterium]